MSRRTPEENIAAASLRLTRGEVGRGDQLADGTIRDFPTFIADIAENDVGQRGMSAASGESNSALVTGKRLETEMTHTLTARISPLSIIRSLYIAARERRWNRDRRRRIAEMRRRERLSFITNIDWVDAMASQLAEIRSLPEAHEPGS